MTTINLYLPRMSHQHFERMMEVHRWIEQQFGRPDYHTNYTLDFGDHTEDWCCYRFYNHTQAFWAQERFQDVFLTEERWRRVVDDPLYESNRTFSHWNYDDN